MSVGEIITRTAGGCSTVSAQCGRGQVMALLGGMIEEGMSFVGEITIGNIVTALSVLLSAAALAYGWRKDREFQRRQYADHVRRAAGVIAAKLERWPAIALQFIDAVQPLALEVDRLVALGEPDERARHDLLRGLYEQRAIVNQRINSEEIESAYVDLYGYDPRIHELFDGAVGRLRAIDARSFARVHDLARGDAAAGVVAGAPGQTLQSSFMELAREYERDTNAVVEAFRAEMIELILASDEAILRRAVPFSPPAAVFPEPPRLHEEDERGK